MDGELHTGTRRMHVPPIDGDPRAPQDIQEWRTTMVTPNTVMPMA